MKRSKFEIRRNADFQLILCVLLLVVDSLKLTCKSIQKHTKHRQHHFRLCSKIKDSEMAKVTRKWIIFHFVEFAAKHKAISDAFRTMLELLTMATDFCWRSTTSNFIFWRHIKANRCTRNLGSTFWGFEHTLNVLSIFNESKCPTAMLVIISHWLEDASYGISAGNSIWLCFVYETLFIHKGI